MNWLYVVAAQVIIIALLIALIIVFWRIHPQGFKIMLAKLRGKDFVFCVRADRRSAFLSADFKEGTLETGIGSFIPDPDDVFSYEGVQTVIAYAPYARTINPKVMVALRKIRELGIKNIDQLKLYLQADPDQKIQVEVEKEDGTKEIKMVDMFSEKEKELIREVRKELEELDGQILNELEVVRVQDVVDFFEEDNPAIYDAKVEREVRDELRRIRNPVMNMMPWVFMFMMVVLSAAIAYAIVKTIGGKGAESGVVEAAKTAIQM